MSKKYKDKDCVYCGAVGASQTGDHIFARGFFAMDDRDKRNSNLAWRSGCHMRVGQYPATLAINQKPRTVQRAAFILIEP